MSDSLLTDSVKPATIRLYRREIEKYSSWCFSCEIVCDNDMQLDMNVSAYISHCYDGKEFVSRQSMVNLVCGLKFFHYGDKLVLSHSERKLKGWQRRHPAVGSVLLSRELSLFLAVKMVEKDMFPSSVCLLLMWDSYLRISEALNLKVKELKFPGDLSIRSINRTNPTWGAVYLPKSKTGNNQAVTIRNPVVIRGLKILLKGRCSSDKVFSGLSYEGFNTALKSLSLEFKLGNKYTTHCCRHGGATTDYMEGSPFSSVKIRGRWVSDKSCLAYINSGRALMISQSIPRSVSLLASLYVQNPKMYLGF